MDLTSLFYVALLGFFFGSSIVSTRFGLTEFSSFSFIGLRMILATFGYIALFLFSSRYSAPTDNRVWKHGAVLGLIGTALPMTAFITALNYLSSGLSAIIGTAGPAITVLLAHFLLSDEHLTQRKAFGVALALGGALMLTLLGESGLPDASVASPIGFILIFGSNISSSLGAIYARRYVRDLDTVQVTSVRTFVGMALTAVAALLWSDTNLADVTQVGISALLYSASISSFAGFLLSLYIITRFGATTSAMTAYIVPVFSTIGGALLLDERITLGMLGGMAIIIAGIIIINSRQQTPTLSPVK